MTFKELLLLMVGGILVNNIVFEGCLGIVPSLGFAGRGKDSRVMALAVAVIVPVSSILCWLVNSFLLVPLGIAYMQTLVFTAVILAVVCIASLIFKSSAKIPPAFLLLTALNSAVLGTAVNSASAGGFPEVIFASLGAGFGFALGMIVFDELTAKIDDKAVPGPFRGLPVRVLAASVVSMALLAFA